MFEFVKDRTPQGTISGQFRPLADQTKFRSIWGVVEGPQVAPWTGSMIENGEIYSADGRARLGGTPVKDAKGNFHDVTSGATKLREYQIPLEAVQKWNRYEAQQGDEQVRHFVEKEQAKAASLGRQPFLEYERGETLEPAQVTYAPATAQSVEEAKPKRERTPAQLANDQRLREKAAAKKAQAAA